ncbi:MAG: hypothetical protein JOY93_06440 [Acidobacteriales bacterium]|nr:hypothetical protein [Terriglobales bacterium]
MSKPRTYLPNPAFKHFNFDDEEPCLQFFHSHSATFAKGVVPDDVERVPFRMKYTADILCQSAS